jgi:predicted metal-dependent HD superfamily phosphohydrolase
MDVRGVAAHAPGKDVVDQVGTDLLARWNEPIRRYHTTTHLVEMFGALEELEDAREIDDRQCSIARLAAWFHDAVYDPAASPGANESDSAALAQDRLRQLSFTDNDIDAIDRLIRLTARHDADASEPLDAAFHDADLWILSAARERFDSYCDQVASPRQDLSNLARPARLGDPGPDQPGSRADSSARRSLSPPHREADAATSGSCRVASDGASTEGPAQVAVLRHHLVATSIHRVTRVRGDITAVVLAVHPPADHAHQHENHGDACPEIHGDTFQ